MNKHMCLLALLAVLPAQHGRQCAGLRADLG